MRLILFMLGLVLASSALAQADPPPVPSAADQNEAASPPPTLPADAALERHFPASQQRRLGEGGSAFLALRLDAAQPEPRGAVLLIGDHGEHADWPELIGPARRQLSEAGWHTLAIALPAEPPQSFGLSDEALRERSSAQREDIAGRLQLALGELTREMDSALPTVIIARGGSAYWALLNAEQHPETAGLILFQPRSPAFAEPGLDELAREWERPLLELIPSGAGPLAGHRERATNARRLAHANYRQWQVGDLRGAPQSQAILIRRLQGWLERLQSH